MKTTTGHSPCGWLLKGACAMVGLSLCASVWAETNDKNVVALAKPSSPMKSKKVYLMMISNSAIPQPIDRAGVIPTTATPMEIIGIVPNKQK